VKHSEFQKIREGDLDEARAAYRVLALKAEQWERLRGHAVTEEEEQLWIELREERYLCLKNIEAARRIKEDTGTYRAIETIRKHII